MTSPSASLKPDESTNASQAPSLFDYQDYRAFLGDWLAWKKSVQPNYSGAVFARKAGIRAHTLLGMVIRGERNLSYDTIHQFARSLGLQGRETAYFERLVFFNQARNSDDKARYFKQLLSVSTGRIRQLRTTVKNHADYLSHWYVVAIRELVAVEGFDPSPDWIVRKLKRKITRKQAQDAWELLLRLGMVEVLEPAEPGQSPRYRLIEAGIDLDPGQCDFAIRRFHREYLERARDAIDTESLAERELSSFTMAVSEDDLQYVRERIKEFRRELNQTLPRGSSPRTRLVAVNFQMLVLTKGVEE